MSITRLLRTDSGLLFHARYSDGLITALTGQEATFSRSAAANATDSNGATISRPHSLPRYEVTDGVPALLIEGGANPDELYHGWKPTPARGLSVLVTFVWPASGSPVLMRLGGSAPDLVLDISSGELRVVHDNDTSTVSSTTSGLNASGGDVVEARVAYHADGSVEVGGSVEGVAEVSGSQSSTLTPGSAWGSERIYTGGLAAENDSLEVREVKVRPDPDATLAELRES